MEFDPTRPKWQQIAEEITRRIKSGQYPERFQLSEVRLAAEFGVNRDTIRKATAALRDAGLILTVPNLGTFVRSTEDDQGDA
ncbi:winged helix-turn-helix domain-containing protein [Streptomyces sp. NPDC047315]|uniref:winged helix-turn-helix domain-containing protein n=1 Tax=Streptomyces sp. NPDC047315 TaxID=3155142 RepID=UPI0033D1F30A